MFTIENISYTHIDQDTCVHALAECTLRNITLLCLYNWQNFAIFSKS